MYPTAELNELTARKAVLRQRIAASRWECTALAERVARPIALLDRVVAQWRKISPMAKLAALPLGLLLRKKIVPSKSGLFRRALRWAPVVLQAMRMAQSRRATR